MDAHEAGPPLPVAGGQTCVFARALLAGCASCTLAYRSAVAEREHVGCGSPVAHMNCATLHGLLAERSAFALRITPRATTLPHAIVMKLQCGGLAGLRDALGLPRGDVRALVNAAHERHGSLVDLPWHSIVATVASWQTRRRHGETR